MWIITFVLLCPIIPTILGSLCGEQKQIFVEKCCPPNQSFSEDYGCVNRYIPPFKISFQILILLHFSSNTFSLDLEDEYTIIYVNRFYEDLLSNHSRLYECDEIHEWKKGEWKINVEGELMNNDSYGESTPLYCIESIVNKGIFIFE